MSRLSQKPTAKSRKATQTTIDMPKVRGHSPFVFNRPEEHVESSEPVEFFDDGEPDWRSFVLVSPDAEPVHSRHVAAQVNQRVKADDENADTVSDKWAKLREAGKERAATKVAELTNRKSSAKKSAKKAPRKLVATR